MKEDNPRAIQALFPKIQISMLQPSYNIAPSQRVLVVLNHNNALQAQYLTWGLIPSWSKETRLPGFNNARIETVFEKPSFKDAIHSRRCVIPANGYYEWRSEGRNKQPYYITSNENLIGFAGIWDKKILATGEELLTCAVLTTQATQELQHIHDRMPCILSTSEDCQKWILASESSTPDILELIRQNKDLPLSYYPVPKRINGTKYDDPDLIKKEDDLQVQASLF